MNRPDRGAVKDFDRHSFVGRALRALAVTLTLLLAMQYLEYRGVLAGPEGKLLDSLLRGDSNGRALRPVITVEIDDAAYQACFGAASPLDPKAVFGMVDGISAVSPSVIGVDILTDDKDRAGEYRTLAGSFPDSTARAVWIAGARDPHVKAARFPQWLAGAEDELIVKPTTVLGFTPEELDERRIRWGVPVFPPDPDLALRRFPREIYFERASPEPPEEALSWARIIAFRYCAPRDRCRIPGRKVHEVSVRYADGPERRIRALDIFRCPGAGHVETGGRLWSEFRDVAKDRVVLLGGTWGSARDFHETPIGRMPGVLINAFAVLAEMNGSGIQQRRPQAIAYDIAIGLCVAWIAWLTRHRGLRAMMTAVAALLLGALVINYWLFGRGYVLSFAGFIAGIFLYQMCEFWHMNPKTEEH
jgi:hypothetical protein